MKAFIVQYSYDYQVRPKFPLFGGTTIQAKADFIAPRLPLFPLNRADVMPSMRDHHLIAPLIDPAS